jgi:hypothetical protein
MNVDLAMVGYFLAAGCAASGVGGLAEPEPERQWKGMACLSAGCLFGWDAYTSMCTGRSLPAGTVQPTAQFVLDVAGVGLALTIGYFLPLARKAARRDRAFVISAVSLMLLAATVIAYWVSGLLWYSGPLYQGLWDATTFGMRPGESPLGHLQMAYFSWVDGQLYWVCLTVLLYGLVGAGTALFLWLPERAPEPHKRWRLAALGLATAVAGYGGLGPAGNLGLAGHILATLPLLGWLALFVGEVCPGSVVRRQPQRGG